MADSNDALEEIQNEINNELSNLGIETKDEVENILTDESLEAIEDGLKDVEAAHTQEVIAEELEQVMSDDSDSLDGVDDALGEIESMMESANQSDIEYETVAEIEESVEEDDDDEFDEAFNESELDEIMGEIDEIEQGLSGDNVLPISKGSGEVPMSFSATGEMETELKFSLAGKEVSFCVNKTDGFVFQMDSLTVTVDKNDQVVVNLGGGMKLTAPLDASSKSGKKEAA